MREHRLGRLEAPDAVSRPSAVPRMRIVVVPPAGSGAPGAGTVSNWPSSTVRLARVVPVRGGRGEEAAGRAVPVGAAAGGEDEVAHQVERVAAVHRAGRQRGLVALADLAQHLHRRAVRHAGAAGQRRRSEPAAAASSDGERAAGHRHGSPRSSGPAGPALGHAPAATAGRRRGGVRHRHRAGRRRRALRAQRQRAGRRARSPTVRGRVSRNAAPCPSSPQACSQPPCSRASSTAMDRPRPLPPLRRARDSSARQNRLNTSVGLARPQPDAVVADQHRDRACSSPPQLDPHRPALAVVDRVGHQVAHDPLHPARVDLGVAPRPGRSSSQRGAGLVGEAAHRLDRPLHDAAHVDPLGAQVGHPGVQPADLQQVGQQRLEPVQLGRPAARSCGAAPAAARPARRAARRRPSARWSAGCAARG